MKAADFGGLRKIRGDHAARFRTNMDRIVSLGRCGVVEPARGAGAIRNTAVKRSAPPRAHPTDPLAAADVKEALKNQCEN
jgi:hypothetical protein